MWLRHDFGWWGFVFGLTALILAVPLAITANLLTPPLRNWWAERSVESTRSRLIKLETQLTEYETKFAQISEAEDWTLRGVEFLMIVAAFLLLLGAVTLLMIKNVAQMLNASLTNSSHLLASETNQLGAQAVVVFFAAIGVEVTIFVLQSRMSKFREKHSPSTRKDFRSSIERLRKRLETK
jgi:predicted PurR-regulated permease PerM